jgi:hypothetical protein
MRVDHRGHDRLASQIYAVCARRQPQIALAANLGKPPVLDDERGVFNRRTTIASDEPCTFEQRYSTRRRRLSGPGLERKSRNRAKANDRGEIAHEFRREHPKPPHSGI